MKIKCFCKTEFEFSKTDIIKEEKEDRELWKLECPACEREIILRRELRIKNLS